MADQAFIHKHLRDGIEAVKHGNRVRGRDLLLQVVRQHRGIEQAWWWLSQATEDPEEQLKALENVLLINPEHPEAQVRLVRLRQEQLATVSRERTNRHWKSLLPEVPLEAEDGLDDPYQCPSCGLSTGLEDRKCPHCGGGLYWRVPKSKTSGSLHLIITLMTISMAVGILELLGPIFAVALAQPGFDASGFELLARVPGVSLVLGDFFALSADMAQLLIRLLLVRGILLFVLLVGLSERWTVAYYGTAAGMIADLLLSIYLLITGDLGPVAGVVNGGLALATGISLFGANYEFAVNDEGLYVRPDAKARSALDFYRRGHEYRRLGMWAMAVAQWRKAVGLSPTTVQYHKDLGVGYAQIKRFERSLKALEEAQRQDPEDQEIGEIMTLVRARADTHRMLKR